MTERIPQLLDLQRGAEYSAQQRAVIVWAQESLANLRALAADVPRVLTSLNLRAEPATYDGLVAASERVRVVTRRTAADGWRQWVAYALAEELMHGGVGPEVPDVVLALTNEWLAAWYALDDARAEADALLAAARRPRGALSPRRSLLHFSGV